MAKRDRSDFKAGLFIVVTLFLIAGIIVAIKGVRTVFTPIAHRRVQFALTDDVGGLRPGDDVRLGGFKVGNIESVEVTGLKGGEKPAIVMRFTIPQKYPLHTNAHMAVQGTLTGSSWLNLDNLGDGPLLADDADLPGHAAVTSELINTLKSAVPEVVSLVHDVKTVTLPKINDRIDRAGETLASIKAFADRAAEMAVQVRDLVGESKSDIHGTVKHLNAVTASAEEKVPGILDKVSGTLTKVTSAIDSAKEALEDVKLTAANTRDITGSARSVIAGNRGKFDGIIASLKATSDNLKAASTEIRHSPWRLLYKPGPGEIDNMELYDAARQFSDGAGGVNDAALALRDAMQDPNMNREQLQKLLDKLNDTFANFHEVETKLWKSVRE